MNNDVTIHQPTPSLLLEKAIEKGVDMQQLEKLMELQERWEKKEAKKAFLDALSKFQNILPALKKGKTAKVQMKTGGFFTYKYADLGSITAAINKPLGECGLSYRWQFEDSNGRMKCTCFISHRDGHTETTSMEAGLDNSGAKNDIQQKGSTQTYLQRYTLIGALGLSTAEEDNDARNRVQDAQPDQTEEEVLDQWKQTVAQVKTRVELKSLYLKNRKAVDGSDKIKAIFKTHENQLPVANKEKVAMP